MGCKHGVRGGNSKLHLDRRIWYFEIKARSPRYVKDVFLPQHSSTLARGSLSEKSGCGVSFGIIQITELDFADETVIFAETTEVLAVAFDLRRAAWISSFLGQDQGPGVRWHPGCNHWINSCERWECRNHADVHLPWHCDSLVYKLCTSLQACFVIAENVSKNNDTYR